MLSDNNTYLLLTLLILSFTITPLIRKKATIDFTDDEFFVFNNFFVVTFAIIYGIYLIKRNKCNLSMINKINKTNTFYCALGAITGIAGGIFLMMLLKRNDASFVIPQVQPIVIVLNVLLAYFLFGESMDKYKIIAIVLIFMGLLLLNYSKMNGKINNK